MNYKDFSNIPLEIIDLINSYDATNKNLFANVLSDLSTGMVTTANEKCRYGFLNRNSIRYYDSDYDEMTVDEDSEFDSNSRNSDPDSDFDSKPMNTPVVTTIKISKINRFGVYHYIKFVIDQHRVKYPCLCNIVSYNSIHGCSNSLLDNLFWV